MIGQYFRIGCWMIAALLLGVLLAGSVSSQEKISIGSFEGSLDGWTVVTPATGTLTTTYSNIYGSKVLTAQEGASFGLAKSFDIRTRLENLGAFIARQPLTVEAGDVLTGWSYFGSSLIGFLVSHGSRAWIFVTDGSGELVTSLVYYEAGQSAYWERFEYKFSRSGSFTLELQINSSMYSMGGDYVGLDGIVITSPDRTPPVVTAPGTISISLNPGETELMMLDDRLSLFLSGATALDEIDSDITAKAVNLPQSFALGETEVRFEATDQAGNTGFATSTVAVVKGNIPPIALDDSTKGKSGQAVSIAVTDNDSDADGDSLTVTIAQPPKHGTVTVTTDGITAYTADVDFIGSDEFTYKISDGRGGTASATVTITVKSPLGPVVTAPPELVITVDTGVEQVAVSDERIAAFLSGATAIDEIDGVVSASPVDIPAAFPTGETAVRFQAVDQDGNMGSAYSKIIVKFIPAICKPLPGPSELEQQQPVPGEYTFDIFAEKFLANDIITREQLAELHPNLLFFRVFGDDWTREEIWYADEKDRSLYDKNSFDPEGLQSVQEKVTVLDDPSNPMAGDRSLFFEEIRYSMTWRHANNDFVRPAWHDEFTLDTMFKARVTFRIHTLEEDAQDHIVQLLHKDPARKFPSPADEQQYRKTDKFDDVFDEAYYAPSFFNTGFSNLSSPVRFLGRKCRAIIEIHSDLDVSLSKGYAGAWWRGGLAAGLTDEQEKNLVEPSVGAMNALGIEMARYFVNKAIKINAGFVVERYARPKKRELPSAIPIPTLSPPAQPSPPPIFPPPAFTPPTLPEKLRTPADIMGAIEKNFRKLPLEEQDKLINKLKHLPIEEKEQLSPFFRGLLEKGKE